MERIVSRLGLKLAAQKLDGQVKYGIVASGDADLYLRIPNPRTPLYREKIWDHAAGLLLVEEAGGMVTDVDGKEPRFFLRNDAMPKFGDCGQQRTYSRRNPGRRLPCLIDPRIRFF